MNLSFKVSKPNYENNSNENNRLYCFTSVTLTFLNLIWYSFRRSSLEAQMGVIKNFKTKLALYQYLSVYCPNAGKYGAKKLRIRTLFLQCQFSFAVEFLMNFFRRDLGLKPINFIYFSSHVYSWESSFWEIFIWYTKGLFT